MAHIALFRLRDAIEKKRFGVVRRVLKVLRPNDPHALKHAQAASAWRRKFYKEGGHFSNGHYEAVYTRLFGLDKRFFGDKRILDIGCGPRGSLEWADNATETVGADPLVGVYRRLGTDRHRMKYVEAGAERLPFPDEYFDVTASINSLDHVDDVNKAMREMLRVTKPGGSILISVEVDHPPSATEPTTLSVDEILAGFPNCSVAYNKVYSLLPGEWSNDVASLMAKPERPAGSRQLGGMTVYFVKH